MIIKKADFSAWVEKYQAENKETYLDTVLRGCEEFSIDIEMVNPLLTEQIILKIKAEATDMHYFKTTTKNLEDFL